MASSAKRAVIDEGEHIRTDVKRAHRDEAATALGSSSAAPAAAPAATQPHPAVSGVAPRAKELSRKLALIIAYRGTGYSGLQRNPGVRAIEDDILMAAERAGCFLPGQVNDLKALWWCRCARTDKGVHALANVLSFKCQLPDDQAAEGVAARLNEYLPKGLLAIATRRATRGFDAHKHCNSREYDYLLPVSALRCPSTGRVCGSTEPTAAPAAAALAVGQESTREAEQRHAGGGGEEAPLSEAELAAVNRLLAGFVGTHNFHNYTHGFPPTAAQARRYMLSARVMPAPSLRGVPFVALRFKGSSFLINQIRKMVAVTLARARGLLGDARFAETLSTKRLPIMIAPASGLMLRGCFFDHYDKTFGVEKARTGGGKLALSPAEAAISEAFCAEFVLPEVGSEENAVALREWLVQLDDFDFDRDLDESAQAVEQEDPAPGVREM